MPTSVSTLAALLLACVTFRAPAAGATARPAAFADVPAGPLPWIADDYTRAVAMARARKVPIFVEAWAPW